MRITERRPARRGGFTLIEMLVVIVIIAILATLVLTAGSGAIRRTNEAAVRTEFAKIETAITSFQTAYNVDHVPSLLWIDESGAYNTTPVPAGMPADMDGQSLINLGLHSQRYLRKLWPRLTFPVDLNNDGAPNGNNTGMNVILQGHQALVYLLGGIDGTQGFGNDPALPCNFAAGRKGPFYEFESGRLHDATFLNWSNGQQIAVPGLKFYRDRFSDKGDPMPIAYFSSYGAQNGYWRYNCLESSTNTNFPADCRALLVYPYQEFPTGTAPTGQSLPTKFYQANGVQLICAGRRGNIDRNEFKALNPSIATRFPLAGGFGFVETYVPQSANMVRTYWTPAPVAANAPGPLVIYPSKPPVPAPPPGHPIRTTGYDDLTNFYGNTLGTAE